jgi:hypothetical protein
MQAYAIPSSAQVNESGERWLEQTFPGLIDCIRANDPTPSKSGVTALIQLAAQVQRDMPDEADRRRTIQNMLQSLNELGGRQVCSSEIAGRGLEQRGHHRARGLSSTVSDLRSFLVQHKKAAYVTAGVVAVVGIATGGYYLLSGSSAGG